MARPRPRLKAKFSEGQAVYMKEQDEWVRILEVKYWDSGQAYYWVTREGGFSSAVREEWLT